MSKQFKPGKNAVEFDSDGHKISAHLFLPDDYDPGKTYPAVTVTPPVTGVKEQTGGIYAKALSERGFATLVFDPRGWGESEGKTGYLIPEWFVRDVRNAVDFLRTLDVTDTNNVFNAGVCMGSGWAMYETAFDTRINAVAMISPYFIELDTPLSVLGAEGYRNLVVKALTDAAQVRFDTGEEVYIKPVPETEEEIAAAPEPLYVGMRDYYLAGMPGDTPTWKNQVAANSQYSLFGFSIFNYTKLFDPIPMYLAYGGEAVSNPGAIRFADEAKPEKVTVIEGAGHFDLYWRPEHVEKISNEVAEFFQAHMQGA
ncbi:alpha/beta hydrolase [Maricaulis sp. D1M11]|uniref:alpha/beta hydrolase n=1 Tax=Maricaulis sp. D1M11 TaxID=3076117 RepID=UPI0039B60ABF